MAVSRASDCNNEWSAPLTALPGEEEDQIIH